MFWQSLVTSKKSTWQWLNQTKLVYMSSALFFFLGEGDCLFLFSARFVKMFISLFPFTGFHVSPTTGYRPVWSHSDLREHAQISQALQGVTERWDIQHEGEELSNVFREIHERNNLVWVKSWPKSAVVALNLCAATWSIADVMFVLWFDWIRISGNSRVFSYCS